MTWFLTDWHWLAVLGVWCLVVWFAVSLCMVAATPPPPVDEVQERRTRVRRAQAQIDAERNRTGRDIVTDATARFVALHDPHPRTPEADQ